MNSAFSLCLAVIALVSWVAERPQAVNAKEAYTRGSEAAKAGNFREALEELEKAAALAPDDPRVHNLTGLVLTQLRKYDEADSAYNRALKLAPNFLPARKNRAVNYFSRRDFATASSEFEALRRLIPNDFVPPLFLGLLALEGADTETALPRLQEAEKLAPRSSQVLIPLTRAYFLVGQREAALATSRKLDPDPTERKDAKRFELGVILAEFGENAEAERIFADLWKRNFLPYDSGFNVALLRYRAQSNEEALRAVEEMLARGLQTGELLSLQAWIYNGMARLELARQSLEQAIAIDPDAVEHYLDLSMVHVMRGDPQAALGVLSRALDRLITGDQLPVQIGLVHQATGRTAEAEGQYRRTVEDYPESGPAYLALANLFLTTGREDEGVQLLARAVEALPQDALVHHAYGAILLARAQSSQPEVLEKAGQALRRALQLNPRYADTAYLLGKYYVLKKEDPKAEAYFKKACYLDPRHVEAHYRLSRFARQRGELRRAEELARIVERLRMEERTQDEARFEKLVNESLRGSRGRAFKGLGGE